MSTYFLSKHSVFLENQQIVLWKTKHMCSQIHLVEVKHNSSFVDVRFIDFKDGKIWVR